MTTPSAAAMRAVNKIIQTMHAAMVQQGIKPDADAIARLIDAEFAEVVAAAQTILLRDELGREPTNADIDALRSALSRLGVRGE